MGVTGLWQVVQPCARPIKIETLNKKRLAVDASIWIYQFLKAVRDKEGNALRNSHVVGFFRRLCKLLFLGIKPVFVFDGGAPALKRQTITGRRQRREGRREDAVRTAGKLLALQMQRRAEEDEKKRREEAMQPQEREEEIPENLVYVEELDMTEQERRQNRGFKKKDQYHLPELDVSMAEMGAPNDPRVMSLEELEEYARQFNSGEDINVYDFSKIDFDSPFFQSLPPSDRYNILNAARLRSRLRMGYSKDQLDNMFPDRMAFSRFQIERVKERNELTQRLMHVNGMGDDIAFGLQGPGRIAGEKGREYVLVRNAGEGGWALGVIGDKDEGKQSKPIDVDKIEQAQIVQSNSSDEDDAFEDVPIEGLNRLPKQSRRTRPQQTYLDEQTKEILNSRTALYKARQEEAEADRQKAAAVPTQDPNSLFIDAEDGRAQHDPEPMDTDDDADDDLRRAIAMSLEKNDHASSLDDDDFEEVFPRTEVDSQHAGSDADNDDMEDLEAALAAPRHAETPTKPPALTETSQISTDFGGPLPFESLDLGSSILGKKKMKKIEEDTAGGFERANATSKNKEPAPIPPWFSGDVKKGLEAQKAVGAQERLQNREARRREQDEMIQSDLRPRLQRQETNEVIDVDTLEPNDGGAITIVSSDDDGDVETVPRPVRIEDHTLSREDPADRLRAEPSLPSADLEPPSLPADENVATQAEEEEEAFEWEASDEESTRSSPVVDLAQAVAAKLCEGTGKSPSPEFEDVEIAGGTNAAPPDSRPETAESNDAYDQPAAVERTDEEDGAEYDSDVGGYSSEEDEELMYQMATEAEEHARFASSLNANNPQSQAAFETELKALRSQQRRDRRDADEVTATMVSECQQLLALFGVPYVTAPMEAEAQCAEFVRQGLVDGIVTDDSDIFLFGGTRVYKNMFNTARYVECYLTADLEREFDLSRARLIRIAHLLGSDYTEGLPGIGPVTALEILAEFPDGLDAFKSWWTAVQNGGQPPGDDSPSAFRTKFRRNAAKLFLPPSFPDVRVDKAYFDPQVDTDPSPFVWGVPDLAALRAFLMATIGWSQARTDEVLVPVVRDMNRRETEGTQANITQFLGSGPRAAPGAGASVGAGAFAPRRRAQGKSRRMEGALARLAERAKVKRKRGAGEGVEAEDVVIELPGSAVRDVVAVERMAGSKPKAKRKASVDGENTGGGGDDDDEDNEEALPKTKRRKGRSRRAVKKAA